MNTKVLHTLEYNKIIDRLLEHAATSLGKAHIELLLPTRSLDEVKDWLQDTDEASTVVRLKGMAPFGGIHDIGGSLKRSQINGVLNASELLDIASTVGGGRKLKRFLAVVHENHPIRRLAARYSELSELKPLEEAIRACIDEQGEVLDHASAELARIRRERRTGETRVREKLDQMIRTPSVQKMLQDNLITVRNDRYVIPVKQEYRGSFGGIIHDQSASGATLFIEPESLVPMNNKIRELILAERKEIDEILMILTAQVADHSEPLAYNLILLGMLDFIFAKAGLAAVMKAEQPRMNDRGFIRLRKGRHPLISSGVVPLDIELGNTYSAVIVTGPNTGGKTVALKTVGLLSLMAMSGLFIPAEDGSQMCVFDAVFADIGDEQSIEQNLSTFSSHMTNIISIIHDMTPKSLVLLDELGAGTDPAEGSALAIAILDHMHNNGARIIATTHYSELKAYAYDRKGMINASMEFDIQTLSPTFRLLIGVPGRSNAFAIAKRLGLSSAIIEHAGSEVGEEDKRVESMIASLEQNRLSTESEHHTVEALRKQLEAANEQLEQDKMNFELLKQQMLRKAEVEAQEAVAKARREADEIIEELRSLALEEAGSIKEHKLIEAKKKLDLAAPKLSSGASTEAERLSNKSAKIDLGAEVLVLSLGQKGHVVELSGEEATVQLGIMKMKVMRNDLQLIRSAAQATKSTIYHGAIVKRSRDDVVRTELDLRGSNLEESIMEVDRFLDEAFLSNLGQVYIIHGKGTGVLRTGIQEYLRRHSHVKTHRLGNYGEGGTGVTVVEFK